jgi:rubrerythrin
LVNFTHNIGGGEIMVVKLTQKEQMLLQDLKSHEEWCIKKYTEAQNRASDPALKQTFGELLSHERQHLETVNQILAGNVPSMNQSSQNAQTGQNSNTLWGGPAKGQNPTSATKAVQSDIDLCQDLLNNEKYVSSVYDTVIFECEQKEIRDALNHIQKEEQQHGEKLFKYMKQHGGYNVQ